MDMCKDCRCELYLGALFLKPEGKWITVLEFILQLIESRETQKVFLKIFEGSLLFFFFMKYAGIRMCDSWWQRIQIETESAGSYSHELQLCHTPGRLLCDLGFPVPTQLHLQVRSLLQGRPYWPNAPPGDGSDPKEGESSQCPFSWWSQSLKIIV